MNGMEIRWQERVKTFYFYKYAKGNGNGKESLSGLLTTITYELFQKHVDESLF